MTINLMLVGENTVADSIPPSISTIRYFDHVPSDRVDVIPNAAGEFVQVWSAPRNSPGRNVILSYQRTPNGPTIWNSRVFFDSGPWKMVEISARSRTYYYAGDTFDVRYEEIMPSGQMLVKDPRGGLAIRRLYTAEFDWNKRVPIGKPLSNRASIERQDMGQTWFVSIYQETSAGESVLRMVEEHEGRTLLRVVEMPQSPEGGK